MEFREGAEVRSADGEKLGDIERLVVDPSEDSITHLVISKGFFFPEERVVPVDTVADATADIVVLDRVVDADQLPQFVETYYVDLDDATTRQTYPTATRAPLVWGYPYYGGSPLYPTYPMGAARKTVRNVPDGSVAIPTGAQVVTADGEDIGKVKAIDVSPDGELQWLAVDPGWFRSEQTIPAHFVRTIDEGQVSLAVGADTLRQFER